MYHVTFRGNARQEIFLDVTDRNRMLSTLERCSESYQVRVFLYCLMPNHVHLLLQTPKANLDRFMGSLLTGYSVYFNRRHDRIGHVMQGRYHAPLVTGDAYLLNLSRYVHLNPVRTDYWKDRSRPEQQEFLSRFAWSSYRAYIGLTAPPAWLETGPLTALVSPRQGQDPVATYQAFVEEALANPQDEFAALMSENPLAIGPDEFVARVRSLHDQAADGRIRPEDIALRKEEPGHSADAVLEAVQSVTGLDLEALSRRKQAAQQRSFLARSLHVHAGLTQREIAPLLGVTTGAAVSGILRRYSDHPDALTWEKALKTRLGVSP
jgi:REP element-mobilizing transposase RayT